MTTHPDEFEDHALRIEKFEDEISKRCAISRGYYHVFHRIREENKSSISVSRDESWHKAIRDHFNDLYLSEEGKKFFSLYRKRCKADYDLNKDVDSDDLEEFKKKKAQLLEVLENYDMI